MSKKYWGPGQPYKTEESWTKAFDEQAQVVADTLKITLDQARVRQYALFASGLMDDFNPDDKISCMMVDAFLTNPAWDNQPKTFGEKSK